MENVFRFNSDHKQIYLKLLCVCLVKEKKQSKL